MKIIDKYIVWARHPYEKIWEFRQLVRAVNKNNKISYYIKQRDSNTYKLVSHEEAEILINQ